LSFSTSSVRAICSGFALAIGNVLPVPLNSSESRWNVYDDSCNVVDGLTTNQNPCTQGIFGCSPPPLLFVSYTSTVTGLRYACVGDPSTENCDGNAISVCCNQAVPPQSTTTTSTSGNTVTAPPPSTNSQAPSTSSNTPSSSSISSDFAPSTPNQSSDFAPTVSSAPASETTSALATKSGISTGAIAGIVIGVVLLLLIIALTALFCYKKRQNQPPPPALPFLSQGPTDMSVTQPLALARAPTPAHTRNESSDVSTSAWTSRRKVRNSGQSIDGGPIDLLHGRLPPPYNQEWEGGSSSS